MGLLFKKLLQRSPKENLRVTETGFSRPDALPVGQPTALKL